MRVGSEPSDLSLQPSLVTDHLERRAEAEGLGDLRRRGSAAGHGDAQHQHAGDRRPSHQAAVSAARRRNSASDGKT